MRQGGGADAVEDGCGVVDVAPQCAALVDAQILEGGQVAADEEADILRVQQQMGDVEVVERRGGRLGIEDFADQSRMQRQCVNIGDGFGQLFGGDVLNRADVEALVYHAVGGAVVYAFASDECGDGLPQRCAVVGGGFGGEAV